MTVKKLSLPVCGERNSPQTRALLFLDGDVHGGPAEKGKEIVECQLPALPARPGPGGPLPTAAVFWFFKTGLGS